MMVVLWVSVVTQMLFGEIRIFEDTDDGNGYVGLSVDVICHIS